jgi:hypothetical protein
VKRSVVEWFDHKTTLRLAALAGRIYILTVPKVLVNHTSL